MLTFVFIIGGGGGGGGTEENCFLGKHFADLTIEKIKKGF